MFFFNFQTDVFNIYGPTEIAANCRQYSNKNAQVVTTHESCK